MNANTILSNATTRVFLSQPTPAAEAALLAQGDPAHWETLLLAPLRAHSAQFLAHAQAWRQETDALREHAAPDPMTMSWPLTGRADRDSLVREIVLFTEMVELLDLLWQSVEPTPGRHAGLTREASAPDERLRLRQKLRDALALARDLDDRLAQADGALSCFS